MKIIIRQKNGLGNQLFQYAAGLYFARKYDATLEVIPQPADKAESFGYARPFLLSNFLITAKVRDGELLDRILCSTRFSPAAAAARLLLGAKTYNPHFSTDWIFQPDLPVTSLTQRLYLYGFFQAFQYAQGVEAELRREFAFRNPPSGLNLEALDRIRSIECPVSLHLRRGDYTLVYGGRDALPLTYYHNAITAIREAHANPTVFVFSDDIDFARKNLPALVPMVFVDHNDALAAHEDLRLMSACSHHIIANSTFSWWGAWLNPNPAKLVIAPDRWLDPAVPHPDLLPRDWRRVAAT
jgi:hypothetical protein